MNARRHGRVRAQTINCELGTVLDLSASGVRVRHKGRLKLRIGDQMAVSIRSGAFRTHVDARIIWLKKIGFRTFELGLEFVDLCPEAKKELLLLARSAPQNAYFVDLD